MMEVNNTTSRQEHWWFLMRQRASGTVNPEMKKTNIYMFSQIFCFLFLLYKCQKRISWWCPSRFRFRTSPCYLMVVLLPSWGKNKCRALVPLYLCNIEFKLNPLRAKFFRGNINIYLHFMSLLHIDMIQVRKILPQVRPVLTYST